MARSEEGIRRCLNDCETWLTGTGATKVQAVDAMATQLGRMLQELRLASVVGRFGSYSIEELRIAVNLCNDGGLHPPAPCDAPVPSKGSDVDPPRRGRPPKEK